MQNQGSTTQSGELAYSNSANTLDAIFSAAGVSPQNGTKYQLNVGYSDYSAA